MRPHPSPSLQPWSLSTSLARFRCLPEWRPCQICERALDAYERRAWQEAYDALSACESLTAAQIDLLADSADWVGRPDETIAAYQRAYELHLADGDARRAALSAFMTAIFLRLQGEGAQADGWQSRAFAPAR